jgi:hypothetical protein
VRVDRLQSSQSASGTVCAKPATASVEASVQVAFPGNGTQGATSFGVSGTAGNWTTTTTTTGWPTGATAWLGIGTATTVSTNTVTFPSTDLVVGTLYCFNFSGTTTLTTPTTAATNLAGTVTTRDSVPATIDSGTWTTSTVSSDQITVTASINQSFSFTTAGGGTDALGTLTTGAVASNSTTTFTVSTNAKNGWSAWVKDSNTGLNSSSASYTISSTVSPGLGNASAALVAGTEGYNVGIALAQTSGTCNTGTSVNANFDKAGGSNKGGSIDPTLRTIVTCGGTSNAAVITPTNFAAITSATPAATDYTDTQTYVAAGLF